MSAIDDNRVKLMQSVTGARGWDGKITTYAQLDQLLQARKQYAISLSAFTQNEEDMSNTLEIIDDINNTICQFLSIPRK